MADFKDVIIRLQENKNDNREALQVQTEALSSSFSEVIKSQNRSFGQSLSLQLGKTTSALVDIAKSLQTTVNVEKKTGEDGIEVETQQIGSLENVANILTSIHESLERSFKVNEKMALEQERMRLLQDTTGQFASKDDVASAQGDKKGGGKKMALLAGAGALAGAALKGVGGIALMGAAIAAFFGGLALGNEALGVAKESGFDFDFEATKAAAKGFSGIVEELTPSAMIALGGIIGAAAIASKGGGNPAKMALGVGLMGAAITAFFGGLLLGDSVLEGISAMTGGTDFNGFKSVVKGFNGVISEMSEPTMLVIGTLIGAATLASFKTSLKGQAMGLAIASLGLAISGFFVGLVAGDSILEGISVIGGNLNLTGIKSVVKGFNEVIGELTPQSLTALGVIFGLAFLTSYGSATKALKVGYGMTAIGAGISGFFVGLAAGDAALSWIGTDYTALPTLVKNFGDSIGSLDEQALMVLGTLLGAGGLIGTLGSPVKVAAGMGAIGAGIAAFFMAFAAADFVAANVGTGESLVTLIANFNAAISSLEPTALTALSALLGAGAIMGATGLAGPAAIGMGLIGAGIAAFFLAFDGLTKVGDVIGVNGSSTKALIGNMADGVKKLNDIDGENLKNLVGPLALVGPAILAFMGSDGLGGLASGAVGAAKDGFNYLKSFFVDPVEGDKATLIDRMMEIIKPLEDFDATGMQGFIDTSNALTDFINNDYQKGGDDFEYFVNKLVSNVPRLEGALFGGMSVDGFEVQGLANNSDGYFQAQKNIMMLKNALSDSQVELSTTQAESNNAAPVFVSTDNSTQAVTNNSSRASITMGKDTNIPDKTINAIDSFYDPDF